METTQTTTTTPGPLRPRRVGDVGSGIYELDTPDGPVRFVRTHDHRGIGWGYTEPGSPYVAESGFGSRTEAVSSANARWTLS